MNDDLERLVGSGRVLTDLLSRHLSGGSEENDEKTQSGKSMFWHLLNASQEQYRCAHPFGETIC
jgi:hypothetical protein